MENEAFLKDQIDKAIAYFQARPHLFKCLGDGRHRIAFLHKNKNFVIKVAHCIDGMQANWEECKKFKNRKHSSIPFARCRSAHPYAIVIVMEKVEHCPWTEKPDWANYVDCGQVGYTKKNEIVAYDYSNI